MFLKDLFIDAFLAHLISYTTTHHGQDATAHFCHVAQSCQSSFISIMLTYLVYIMIHCDVQFMLRDFGGAFLKSWQI